MASDQATVDAIVLSASGAGDASARKMFGEYALYCEGKLVGLICDNTLFVKPTEAGKAFIAEPEMAPPYRGAKPSMRISPELCENSAWLAELIRATTDALPMPKPKKPRTKKPKAIKSA